MNNDELIERLKYDLSNMIDWAHQVSDEYLEGDPDTRDQYLIDMKSANEAMKLKAGE